MRSSVLRRRKKPRREQAETQERWQRAQHPEGLGGRFTRDGEDWRLNRDVQECVIGLRALLPDLPPDPHREVEAWCESAEAWADKSDLSRRHGRGDHKAD